MKTYNEEKNARKTPIYERLCRIILTRLFSNVAKLDFHFSVIVVPYNFNFRQYIAKGNYVKKTM